MINKARERILAAADPAAAELVRLATRSRNEAVRLRACADLLDRAGFKATSKTEVTEGEGLPVRYQIVLVEPDPRRWENDPSPQPDQLPKKSVN